MPLLHHFANLELLLYNIYFLLFDHRFLNFKVSYLTPLLYIPLLYIPLLQINLRHLHFLVLLVFVYFTTIISHLVLLHLT